MVNIVIDHSLSFKNRHVLVTGADGFIGSHLAETLATLGAKVTALSYYNSFDSFGWLDSINHELRNQMTLVRGDIRDPHFVLRLMQEQEFVFHLAALIAIPHSYIAAQSYVDVNITGTLNILEAARLLKTPKIVHTSTSEVYGTALRTPISEDHPLQAQSPYSATKIGADALATAYALSHQVNVVILRPFNTYGPRQSERAVIPTVIRQILDPDCDSINIGDISTTRDFTFVTDTVEAFLVANSASNLEMGKAYNAGTGHSVMISEMIDLLLKVTGSNKPVLAEKNRFRPDNSEVRILQADTKKLSAATNWQPSVKLEEGLRRTATWWQNQIANGRLRSSSKYMT